MDAWAAAVNMEQLLWRAEHALALTPAAVNALAQDILTRARSEGRPVLDVGRALLTERAEAAGVTVSDLPSWDGTFRGQVRCKACGVLLGPERPGGVQAEIHLGTYNGLCYPCTSAGPYEVSERVSGALLTSHPPHSPSWRRDRETYLWFRDCGQCRRGAVTKTGGGAFNHSWPAQCPACWERHSTHPVIQEEERTRKAKHRAFQIWAARLTAEWQKRLRKAEKAAGVEKLPEEDVERIRTEVLTAGPARPEGEEAPEFPKGWAPLSKADRKRLGVE